MNNDYISREEVLLAITNNESTTKKIANILNIPAADVAEVVHGEWICHEIEDTLRWKECSVCNCEIHNANYNYCPNCGAKMEVE